MRQGQCSVTFGGVPAATGGPAEGKDLGAVWDSLHAMERRVFIDIHEARCFAGYVNYGKVKSGGDATTLVWAALKAHMIQQAYKEARSREHPFVSPIVLFQANQALTKANARNG